MTTPDGDETSFCVRSALMTFEATQPNMEEHLKGMLRVVNTSPPNWRPCLIANEHRSSNSCHELFYDALDEQPKTCEDIDGDTFYECYPQHSANQAHSNTQEHNQEDDEELQSHLEALVSVVRFQD